MIKKTNNLYVNAFVSDKNTIVLHPNHTFAVIKVGDYPCELNLYLRKGDMEAVKAFQDAVNNAIEYLENLNEEDEDV